MSSPRSSFTIRTSGPTGTPTPDAGGPGVGSRLPDGMTGILSIDRHNPAFNPFDPKQYAGYEGAPPSGFPTYIVPGVSMSMIARGTGLSLAAVSRIFSPKPDVSRKPTYANLKKIAAYLKVGVEEAVNLIEAWQEGRVKDGEIRQRPQN